MDSNLESSGSGGSERHLCRYVALAGIGLAFGAAVILASAGFGSRIGLWHFRTGFTLLRYGGYLGGVAALISLAGLALSFKRGCRLHLFLSIVALAVGALTVGLPLSWMVKAKRVPRIHDITTDIVNPPRFVAVLPLRQGAANPAEYGGPEIAAKQLQAYPDLKPLVMGIAPAQAYALAWDAARRMGWKIVAAVPSEGRIEATDTTFWFGFKDDIVIRLTPLGNRTVVDVRSVSRVGISDVGTNAARIRAYLRELKGKE